MKLEKEKFKKDKIIKLCIEMIDKINNIKLEDKLNEKEYQGLISDIDSIIESRIIYLNFWEDFHR